VRLVGDHEVVRLRVEVLPVARKPGVCLDGHGVRALRGLAHEDRVLEAVAVALGRQLAVELRDEQAPVREDQDAERAGGLDEPCRRDRLAGGGRVAEAEAPARAGILAVVLERKLELLVRFLEVDAEIVLVFVLGLRPDVSGAVTVQLRLDLGGRDQLRQHPRQRVDLVPAELRSGGEPWWARAEHPLEPEHQRVADLPVVGGLSLARLDLREGVVQRAAAGGSRGEHGRRVFVRVEEWLSCPGFGAEGGGGKAVRSLRSQGRLLGGFLHVCGTCRAANLSERARSRASPWRASHPEA
jgi:hypothetical protein